jgi:NTE family protein
MTDMNNEKKVGLALGSGGVKGLAHIGVLKVLVENNIPIDYIAGTSIGSLVGAVFSAYKDIEKIEKIVLDTNWKHALALLDPSWRGGIIKGNKVEKLITSWLPNISFLELKIPLTIVATDILSGQKVNLNSGNLISAIRASSAVPPVFKPVKYNDYMLVDGGISNPVPANIAREMGADLVIAVNLDSGNFNGNSTNHHITPSDVSLTKTSIRALNIMRYYLARKYLNLADVVIEPLVPEIGLVGWNKFFDRNQAKKIIEAGQKAAQDAIPEIKKILQ